MDSHAVVAAGNNADWCDLVCRANGVDTVFERDRAGFVSTGALRVWRRD